MKKQILGAMCLAAMMSSCHIYKLTIVRNR